jgi:predicted nucleotidyltransferase
MTAIVERISIPPNRLAEICRRHHDRRPALFGSVLRDDCTPQSDVDVLVEFEPGRTPGLALLALQDELTELFGRQGDLNTAGFLSPYFRDEVIAEAEALYVA